MNFLLERLVHTRMVFKNVLCFTGMVFAINAVTAVILLVCANSKHLPPHMRLIAIAAVFICGCFIVVCLYPLLTEPVV